MILDLFFRGPIWPNMATDGPAWPQIDKYGHDFGQNRKSEKICCLI